MRIKTSALISAAAMLVTAVPLTSCGVSVHGDYYETYRETEGLTESLTEPEPEPNFEQEFYYTQDADLAVFLPILKREKHDAELEDRLRPYMEKIISAEYLLGYAIFSEYYDSGIFAEEHSFSPDSIYTRTRIRSDLGTNREQLLNFFGTVYTDDYINSICENTSLEEVLFGSKPSLDRNPYTYTDDEPLFTEREDGVYRLVVLGAKGMNSYNTADLDVRFFDGKTAEVGILYHHSYGIGYEIFFLRHDEGRGWRLDSRGKNYIVISHSPPQMANYDNVHFEIAKLDMRAGRIPSVEFVFEYFNETAKDGFIEQDGVKYYRVKNNFPIEDMRKIFSAHISEYKWEWSNEAEDFVMTDEPLLQPCIDKYINEVYAEFDGVLYRREDAPVYEIDHPDYNGREFVSAQVSTPALGEDEIMSVFICGGGETAMFLSDGTLVTDIPLKEKEG
ncbi:MAG: hypothetical protein K2J11_07835 [Oscillospiraceae bacterium]|nr:hypothetical protein [Oscillospiraceae bacterium]